MTFTETVLVALLALSPKPSAHPLPGWTETEEQHRARLESFAADVAAVARTRVEAAILVGIAWHESGLQPDVDLGPCHRGPGWEKRCDGGRARSAWQLQNGTAEERELWQRSRRDAAREALRRALKSLGACRNNAPEHRLAAYASGTCSRGLHAARALDADIKKSLSLMPVVTVESGS